MRQIVPFYLQGHRVSEATKQLWLCYTTSMKGCSSELWVSQSRDPWGLTSGSARPGKELARGRPWRNPLLNSLQRQGCNGHVIAAVSKLFVTWSTSSKALKELPYLESVSIRMATVLAALPGPTRSCKHHWPFLWAPRKPELELERIGSYKRPGLLACVAFGTVWTRPLGGKEICRDAAQSTVCCRNTGKSCSTTKAAQLPTGVGQASAAWITLWSALLHIF